MSVFEEVKPIMMPNEYEKDVLKTRSIEYLDIVNEFGEPTGKTVDRNTAHINGIPHRTSHVWLLRIKNNKVQILLQKRSSTKDSFPGCYDISSAGHIPAGFDFIESAVRELKEELGMDIVPEQLVICGDKTINTDDIFYGNEFHDRQYTRIYILWDTRDERDFKIQKEELESVLWMDFEEAYESVKNNTIKHCICMDELDMVRQAFETA